MSDNKDAQNRPIVPSWADKIQGMELTLSEILYQVETTNEVVRHWEYQRVQVRDIITNALVSSIHLDKEPDYHAVLHRIADVLNVALLPSIQESNHD